MGRILAFVYGALSYLVFFVTFLYAIGFVGNFVVPKSIDSGPAAATLTRALVLNILLLSIFAIQHSVMARPAFKRWWTRLVPPPVERSTYVLLASLALILLFWQWRSMTGVIWEVDNTVGQYVLWAVFFLGWAIYKIVRHPIMLGFIIAFWSTPKMTTGHLLFAAVTTVYILVAIQLEERDIVSIHGMAYEDYRKRVSMLLPIPKKW